MEGLKLSDFFDEPYDFERICKKIFIYFQYTNKSEIINHLVPVSNLQFTRDWKDMTYTRSYSIIIKNPFIPRSEFYHSIEPYSILKWDIIEAIINLDEVRV